MSAYTVRAVLYAAIVLLMLVCSIHAFLTPNAPGALMFLGFALVMGALYPLDVMTDAK